MSTVPQESVTEPSAETLTTATDVVGEVTALMAMATPRPRRTVPLPLSSGGDEFIRSRALSSTDSRGASSISRPVACCALHHSGDGTRPGRLELTGDHVHAAFIGPCELRHAEAAHGAGRRDVGVARQS